ncbi:MAG TPA: hypothetical protein VE912_25260 [Bacteroidales bacterium]|nr:hypothetical protein [Bacteroidales bacterium]
MSEEDFKFANFMQTVPTYKYLKILERIVFDSKIEQTKDDDWNYYGEYIKYWYPTVLEILKISDIKIDSKSETLIFTDMEYMPGGEDLLPYSFNDPFLDYIRKEINESYQGRLFLSTMFLSRKLLEVIFTRVLEVVFPKIKDGKYSDSNHNIWYNKGRNGYRNFGELIDGARKNSISFFEDKDLIEELCSYVKPFKDETNSNVHDDYKIPDENYIAQWKVAHIVNIARKVFRKYCNP